MEEIAVGDLTDADGMSGRRPLQEGATRFKSGERSAIEVIGRGGHLIRRRCRHLPLKGKAWYGEEKRRLEIWERTCYNE